MGFLSPPPDKQPNIFRDPPLLTPLTNISGHPETPSLYSPRKSTLIGCVTPKTVLTIDLVFLEVMLVNLQMLAIQES